MALDPSEKDRLRKKMALKMGMFLEAGQETKKSVSCISGHYDEAPHFCELCELTHANEILVVRNRSGRTLRVANECLKEMVRFQVTDVEDLPKWLDKLKELKSEFERRKVDRELARLEERKLLEKKVIVRKRPSPQA